MSVAPSEGADFPATVPLRCRVALSRAVLSGGVRADLLWTRETGLGCGGIMCSSLHCSQGWLPPGEHQPSRAPSFLDRTVASGQHRGAESMAWYGAPYPHGGPCF